MLAQVFALLAWDVRLEELEGLGKEVEVGGGMGDWEGGNGEAVLGVSEGAGEEEER